MARIRTIKPDFWRDEDLSEISAEAALLAIGLLNLADDEGYFKANLKLIEADIFPLRELSGTATGLINELADIGYVELFTGSDGKKYGYVTNFVKHQVINKAKPSEIKALRQIPEQSGSSPVELPSGKEGKGRERNKEGKGEGAPKKFIKPTIEQITEYCKERNNGINPIKFFDHYESNGWKVGKNPMKNWQASVRTWEQRDGESKASGNQAVSGQHEQATGYTGKLKKFHSSSASQS